MANNCLVTKLKASVDNSNLPKLGEFKLTFKNGYINNDLAYVYYDTPNATIGTARIISGTGHFGVSGDAQEVTITTDWEGKFNFRLEAVTECVVAFPNKYQFTGISENPVNNRLVWIDNSELEYMVQNINKVFTIHIKGSFDISRFNLSTVFITDRGCMISGDAYGDFTPYMAIEQNSIIPSSFFNYNNYIYSDLSLIASNVYYIIPNNQSFSWKNTRSSELRVISNISGVINLGNDVDAMLINQANCQVGDNRAPDQFAITINGMRTSASDAAVATLKGNGFTVIVNGVTL